MFRAISGMLLTCGLLLAAPACAQERTVRLHDGPAPGSQDWAFPERIEVSGPERIVHNVRDPEISVYPADPAKANGTAAIVLPGGGLRILSVGDDTQALIERLNAQGITAILLKYRLLQIDPDAPPAAPPPGDPPKVQIVNGNANPARGNPALDEVLAFATDDAERAMRYVRAHAGEWGVDPQRIGMIGTSAGGGVAFGALLGGDPSVRPAFIVSNFGPALQDVAVGGDAPPLFLAVDAHHGPVTDGIVALHHIWAAARAPVELHVYDVPARDMTVALWGDRLFAWLGEQGFMGAAGEHAR
ncbi:alpha/beta hydrolase [Croceicoccus marinus]|uniref:Alpha/beta hydrolase fold domain-containing protein n=1 Tax=Croceicoccus marinus TaxID=450378 RepID=A0A7G6W042_9SPHN|nr:alpha/beta hydrolase [Croceicoccus marinus]QNE07357.1 alpha/beta hydrolase fold domain-containing protein [Croceicoccus marinus]